MLDFQPVRDKQITLQELVKDLTRDDIQHELNEMYNEVEHLIANCTDFDATFLPVDEKADDPNAIQGEEHLAWTLAHVIVHLTATMEEAAALASELAEVTTIDQCRARIQESRKMCLASLEMWPDPPHMENTYTYPVPGALPHTCISRFASGLKHTSDHLEQIAEIVRQAHIATQMKDLT